MWSQDPDLRRRTIRRAMLHPTVYLAASLAEVLDENLVTLTGADLERVWRLRLARWPRPAQWDADVEGLAAWIGCDAKKLDRFFRLMEESPPSSAAPAPRRPSRPRLLPWKPRW